MATTKTIYSVRPLDDERWAVEKKGQIRRSAVMDSKKDAIRRAKELAVSDRIADSVVLKVFDAKGKLEEQLEYDAKGNLIKD